MIKITHSHGTAPGEVRLRSPGGEIFGAPGDASPNPVARHHVPQIFHLLGSEGVLPRVQFQVALSQCFEEPSEMSQMVGPRVAIHDNGVDAPDGEKPFHTTQEHVHHSLENNRVRGETEGQSVQGL